MAAIGGTKITRFKDPGNGHEILSYFFRFGVETYIDKYYCMMRSWSMDAILCGIEILRSFSGAAAPTCTEVLLTNPA
jgi:hypothetical protein